MFRPLRPIREYVRIENILRPLFLDKYFSSTLRTHKEFEFQQLRQGNMLAAGYAERFKDMVAYSKQAMYAPNEKWKVDQFMLGLTGKISRSVFSKRVHYLCEVVEIMLCC